MRGQTRKRPWIAALLAVVYPGLGHVYLRSWFRALLWFWMALLAVVWFVPESTFAGVSSLGGVLSGLMAIPTEGALAILLVIGFNAVDAYWQANRVRSRLDGSTCPHCGKTIDDDLKVSFCHWCTAPLPRAEDRSSR